MKGDDAAEAMVALRDVVVVLKQPPPSEDDSLMSGSVGKALCLSYLGDGLDDSELADCAIELLARAAQRLAGSARLESGLARGAAGLGWVLSHLQRELGWDSEGDSADLDGFLAERVDDGTHALDLLDGLAGVGVYFLERLPAPAAVAALERILLTLIERREQDGMAHTWASRNPGFPFGYSDLSVGYGVPGILGFLGQLAASGIGHSLVAGMLGRGIPWVLSKRLEPGGALPRRWGPNVPQAPDVETWEVGSVAAGAVMHLAAISLPDSQRAQELVDWLRAASRRAEPASTVVRPGLCDGACGLGHVYNRLFQRTRDPAFAELARLWLRRGLALLNEERPTWRESAPRCDLRSGLGGSALALLAAVVDREPAWDRLLLLSPPSTRPPCEAQHV